MKKQMSFLVAIGFATGSILTSCQPSERKVENAKENVEEAKADLAEAKMEYTEEWEKYQNDYNEKFTNNENEINTFKARMDKSDEKFRERNRDRVNELELKNRNLRKKMDDYNTSRRNDRSNDKWEEFKREFNHDMDELGASLKTLGNDNVK